MDSLRLLQERERNVTSRVKGSNDPAGLLRQMLSSGLDGDSLGAVMHILRRIRAGALREMVNGEEIEQARQRVQVVDMFIMYFAQVMEGEDGIGGTPEELEDPNVLFYEEGM